MRHNTCWIYLWAAVVLVVGSVLAMGQMSPGQPTPGAQAAETGTLAAIEVTAADDTLIANGTSSTTITVLATDSSDTPVPDVTIQFVVTALGSIDPTSATTDSNGEATATLTAGTTSGTATVTVIAVQGETTLREEIDIPVEPYRVYLPMVATPLFLTVTADPRAADASDSSSVTLTAQFIDAAGNPESRPDVTINFAASSGEIDLPAEVFDPPQGITGADGSVTTTLSNPDLLVGPMTITASMENNGTTASTTVEWNALDCAENEPNNGMFEALDSQSQLTTLGAVCRSTLGDGQDSEDREGKEDDYYYLDLDSGDTLEVELRDIPDEARYELSLTGFASPGQTNPFTVVEGEDEGSTQTLTYDVQDSGRYFIRVRAESTTLTDNPYLLLARTGEQ